VLRQRLWVEALVLVLGSVGVGLLAMKAGLALGGGV
jgi:hypothetical protein